MIKTKITFLFAALFITSVLSAQSIVGKWKTIDDETGKAESIVKVYIRDGKAYGKIVKLFKTPNLEPNPICDKCTGPRKNQTLIGMTIITGMEKDDEEWVEGEILDPKNGKIYDCKIWLEDGNLKVRGYIAFLYRTQTWEKVN